MAGSSKAKNGTPKKASKDRAGTARGILISVLDVAESIVDGCPIWGPKAAIGATLKVLRGIDVGATIPSYSVDSCEPL